MGLRGPAPTPTVLNELRGNPGKRKAPEGEPKPPAVMPPRPPILTGDARGAWDWLAPRLFDLGLLTEIDGVALATYCQAWAQFVKATKELKANGYTFTTSKGYVGVSPMLAVQSRAIETLNRVGAQFGMTPSSRTRIRLGTGEDEENPLAELLADVRENAGRPSSN